MSYKGYKVHITKDGETSAPSEKVYNQNGGVQAQSTTKAGTVEAGGRKKSNKYRYGVFRKTST